ncbi:DUF6417 family protein [Streptomyces chiangmaiensis]|uniref:DUF6417 family protein n=1 Tax=Streptomyces chiangmaiensis TaxID=766497 RepID=A0ABU7FT07_9ACTN|nr:DUF6417 family protein [Streptomyces chiangmaiensis]MED7827256.1 DUF6417 family protein [Streptomyces chiangmaiensis]
MLSFEGAHHLLHLLRMVAQAGGAMPAGADRPAREIAARIPSESRPHHLDGPHIWGRTRIPGAAQRVPSQALPRQFQEGIKLSRCAGVSAQTTTDTAADRTPAWLRGQPSGPAGRWIRHGQGRFVRPPSSLACRCGMASILCVGAPVMRRFSWRMSE